MSQRHNSTDSGLISSEAAVREQTFVKPLFSSQRKQPDKDITEPGLHPRPKSLHGLPRRKEDGQYQTALPTATSRHDSDTDQGIVPDVTKVLLGRPKRPKSTSSPTYSIHINTLYVYQNPTVPYENPLYQQLPVQEKNDDTPPSPCQPYDGHLGYHYLWKESPTEGGKHPAQHSCSSGTPLKLSSHKSTSSEFNTSSDEKAGHSSQTTKKHIGMSGLFNEGAYKKKSKHSTHISLPADDLSEMSEITLLDKAGKPYRFRLQPIEENDKNFVMDTSDGSRVYVKGITISDNDDKAEDEDEGLSDDEESFHESSNFSTPSSEALSSTIVDTVIVEDCKVNEHNNSDAVQQPTSHRHSYNDLNRRQGQHSKTRKAPAHPNQPKSMHDPTYFDFDSQEDKARPHEYISKSVPNIVLSTKFDTCYECRHQKRGLFSSRKTTPRECTLEGFHYVTDDNEVSFMREILDSAGRLGNWFITPLSNQPGYSHCLYVKDKREVTSFPVVRNKKDKFFIDLNHKKTFSCLCKLTEHYKSTHLPEVKINLSQPLPKDVFPDMNYGADGSGTLMGQYAGVKL